MPALLHAADPDRLLHVCQARRVQTDAVMGASAFDPIEKETYPGPPVADTIPGQEPDDEPGHVPPPASPGMSSKPRVDPPQPDEAREAEPAHAVKPEAPPYPEPYVGL